MFRIKQVLANEFNFTVKHHHLHYEYIQSSMSSLIIIIIIIIELNRYGRGSTFLGG